MTDDVDFAEFVRGHGTAMFRTAYALTASRTAAEDLVQDTLTKLYPRWSRVMQAESPPGYVRRTLVNAFINSVRARSSTDILTMEWVESASGVDIAIEVSNRRLLWQLVHQLPPRQRSAIVLRYFEDWSDQRIAETLGCRVATVRSLTSRAIATMRADYDRAEAAADRSQA